MPHFRLSGAKGTKTFLIHLSCFNAFVHLVCNWGLYCWGDLDLWQQGWGRKLCYEDASTGWS